MSEEEKQPFTVMIPAESKKAGRRVTLRPDWEEVKVGIMEEIVRTKFTQNEDLKCWLIGTGDAELVEGNTWHDTCWGVDAKTDEGQNHLGKILMKVLEKLKR